jgi:predicted Zn finger-like uncharacterized protein
MSLLTSCPGCGTVFKVKPEQLVPSRGDVRCGSCGQIFNALQSLSVAEPSQETPEHENIQSEHEPVGEISEEEAIALEAMLAQTGIDNEEEVQQPEPAFEPPAEAVPEPLPEPAPPLQPAPMPVFTPATERKPFGNSSPAPKPATARPRRKQRISSWGWPLICVVLALLAIGQVLYFLRSEIAVRLPQIKPYLVQACAAVGCKVELPQNAQLLSIDDSDLQEHAERKSILVLTATIINRAPYPQAYPLLELTLTDIHDKPILRRTLRPQEYLPAETDLEVGLPPGSDLHVNLPFTAAGIAATGYRVYVRYP